MMETMRGRSLCFFAGILLAFVLCPELCPAPVQADPLDAGSGGFVLPFSDDAEMARDFQALAPPFLPWGPNTSGPFFTGTAEVEPIGSWYLEPFAYDFINPGIAASSLSMPMRLAVGLGHNL